jgi:hypothetical protein
MATSAQIHANRANSQKSTGPATPEGKAISSANRLSHGFASSTRFIKGEDPEEFYALLNDLTLEHQPATPTEQILVEKMAHNQWISLRAIRIQGEIIGKEIEYATRFDRLPPDVALVIRYQTTADRAFHKAYADLLKAKKEREKSKIGFESPNALKVAEPTAESVEKPTKPPVVSPKPALGAPANSDFISIQNELNWIKNATVEEMRASGL